MRFRELNGREVIDADARLIGHVKDIEVDLKKWAVTAIIVKTGFIKKKQILAGDIDKIGDKVVLKVAIDKIQKT